MNNIKKILAVLICLLLVTAIAGCGSKEPANENDLQNEIDNVQGQIKDIANENSKNKVGKYVTPDESAFIWETVDGGVAITEYTGSDKAVIIPETLGGEKVVEIRSGAFNNAGTLGVKLPNTMTVVTEKAFFYCTTLLEVHLSDSITQIDYQAFEGCVSLSKVNLNSGLQIIGGRAFPNCQMLTEITFNEGLTEIGDGAFCMSGLKEAKIPGSVKTIGRQSFTSCDSLKKVEICSGVEVIEETAFEGCDVLEKAIVPASVTEIGLRAFNQCEKITIYGAAGSAAETYATEDEIAFKVS